MCLLLALKNAPLCNTHFRTVAITDSNFLQMSCKWTFRTPKLLLCTRPESTTYIDISKSCKRFIWIHALAYSHQMYTPKWCDINEGNSMSHHFRPMYFTYPRFMWLTHPWIASAMHSRNSCGEVKEKHKRIWFLWARLGFFSRDIGAMSQLVLHSLIQTHLPVKIVASAFEISLL